MPSWSFVHALQLIGYPNGFALRTFVVGTGKWHTIRYIVNSILERKPESTCACVFAKPLIPGKVKTRLIAMLGVARSVALASAMFRDVWQTVSSCDGVLPVLATTDQFNFPVSVVPENIWLQGAGDLGARIERIFGRALAATPAAMVVGADSPLITAAHIERALHELTRNDAVIGKCADGGFYLLGLRRCPPGLFLNLPWSTSATARATTHRLENHGFRVAEIEMLFDVDTLDDVQRLAASFESHPWRAPATRAWCLENAELLGNLRCGSAS